MTLNLDGLLWKMRGKSWDFEFVWVPKAPHLLAWGDVFDEIFNDSGTTTPETLQRGLFQFDGIGRVPFIATVVQDASRTDQVGRPVLHFIVLFGPNGCSSNEWSEAGAHRVGWAERLVARFSVRIGSSDFHELSKDRIDEFRKEKLTGALAAHLRGVLGAEPLPIAVTVPATPVRIIHWKERKTISRPKVPPDRAPLPSQVRQQTRRRLLSIGVILVTFILWWWSRKP